ncbi:conserved hypothetical protein [Vibrio chagasii]|nr:conserved hypothetical protein [Vibrio chagasii]
MNQSLLTFIKNSEKPTELDALTVEVDGITVHAYGTLHALTGGTSHEYVNFVNETTSNLDYHLFCEKSMKTMYKGLDTDVHDWAVIPLTDAFLLGLTTVGSPFRLFEIFKTVIKEKITKVSRFGKNGVHVTSDLGGSPYFHTLHPHIRRELIGFPSSEEYLWVNKLRRDSHGLRKVISTGHVDPDYTWLGKVERYVNIPYRSVHMAEYVVQYAKKHGMDEVGVVVGETHASDIHNYLSNKNGGTIPEWFADDAKGIESRVSKMIESRLSLVAGYIGYTGSLMAGVLTALAPYIALAVYCLVY